MGHNVIVAPWQKPVRGTLLNKAHPLARGLVGAWVMNEGSGGKVFDLSGNGNHGTASGGVTWDAGRVHYDGSSGYHNIPYSPELYCEEMTVCFKYKADTLNHSDQVPAIVSMYDYASANRVWGITPDSDGNPDNWEIMTSSDGSVNNRAAFTPNIPIKTSETSVAVTVKNSTQEWQWYENGVYVDKLTASYTYADQSSWLRIGGLSADYNFDGLVWYVYIYKRILLPAEVASLNRAPYQMFQPMWVPLYVAAGGISIPVVMHHRRMAAA